MPSSTSPTILGLDVHKNTISAGFLRPGHDVADVEKISLSNPEVFVHPFRSNPYTDSGVFVHPEAATLAQ